MNRKELAGFDGQEGRQAYVAVSGKIYDVTASQLWKNGNHEGAHRAGTDLTEELKTAPHVRSVIERFPVVAQMTEPEETPPRANGLALVIGVAVVIVAVALFIML